MKSIFVFLFFSFPLFLFSQVTITPANDKGICISPAYVALGSDIVISEDQNTVLSNGGTYDIRVPSNFEIENGSGVSSFTGGRDITGVSLSYPDSRTIRLTITTDNTENADDDIRITFDIRAITAPSFGTIVRSGGSVASNSFIHGVLSSEQEPYITGLASSYCTNDPDALLNGVPNRGTFSGNGITDNANGTATFDPGAGGAGNITYTVSTGTCQAVKNFSTNINSPTFVSIPTPNTSSFTTSSPPINLAGNPVGGSFTGPAISAGKFYPAIAGAGSHVITYTFTNAQGCVSTSQRTLTVTNGGSVFPCLPSEICLNNANVIDLEGCGFNPSLPPGKEVFDYVVYNLGGGTWDPLPSHFFNPANYTQGYQYVGYRIANNGSPTADEIYPYDYQLVYIKSSGSEVNMYTFPTLCLGTAPFNITNYAYPAGGSFTCSSVPGAISQNAGQYFFNPNSSGAGTFTVQYNPPAGACGGTVQQDITVYPSPYTTGAQMTLSSRCFEDTISLTDLTAINTVAGQTNTIDTWYWRIDNNINIVTAVNQLDYKFLLPGSHDVEMFVYSNHGCYENYTKTFNLGAYPKTNFTWNNDCYDTLLVLANPPMNFVDATSISFGTVTSRHWYFGEPGAENTGNNTNVNHVYGAAGKYTVKLVTISNTGCADSTQYSDVYVYPIYKPTSAEPYVQNFRNANGGYWGVTGAQSSWRHGSIAKNIISNSKPYWVTSTPSDNDYYNGENSQLVSPCFDFSSLTKPMIAMRIWSATPNLIAGAVLEYSTNNGTTWNLVGDKGQGENWYDEIGIAGSPGSSSTNVGWTGTYSDWKIARIGLSALAGLPNVRLRINFGAPNDTNIVRSDGFALDSVWIGNRTKLVLIEHFTNVSTLSSSITNANNAIQTMRTQRPLDVAIVNYHTSFPASDPYSIFNTSDPGSRVLTYGIPSVPHSVMDGNYYNGNVYSGGTSDSRIDVEDIDARSLKEGQLDISVNTNFTSGQVKIGVLTKYLNPIVASKNLTLHVTVVEDTASSNNSMNSVLRKMLPNAAGIILANWDINNSITHYYSWTHTLPPTAKLAVIAFVQDLDTKEVYQAAYIKGSGAIGTEIVDAIEESNFSENAVWISPNPASEKATVSVSGATSSITWELINPIGNVVGTGILQKNTTSFDIATSQFSDGIYVVRLRDESGISVSRKLILFK